MDKPCKQTKKARRLTGGAWQIRTFLKLFSVIIEDKIKDIHDPVWLAVTKIT